MKLLPLPVGFRDVIIEPEGFTYLYELYESGTDLLEIFDLIKKKDIMKLDMEVPWNKGKKLPVEGTECYTRLWAKFFGAIFYVCFRTMPNMQHPIQLSYHTYLSGETDLLELWKQSAIKEIEGNRKWWDYKIKKYTLITQIFQEYERIDNEFNDKLIRDFESIFEYEFVNFSCIDMEISSFRTFIEFLKENHENYSSENRDVLYLEAAKEVVWWEKYLEYDYNEIELLNLEELLKIENFDEIKRIEIVCQRDTVISS